MPSEDGCGLNEYYSIGINKKTTGNIQNREMENKTTPAESLDKIELLMKRIEEKTQNSLKKISELTIDNSDALEKALKADLIHPKTSVFNEVEEEVEVFDASSVHEISFKKELKHFFESNSSLGNLPLANGPTPKEKDSGIDSKREKTVFELASQNKDSLLNGNSAKGCDNNFQIDALLKKKSKIMTEGLKSFIFFFEIMRSNLKRKIRI